MRILKKEPKQSIIDQCFWEYKFSVEDLKKYLISEDWQIKKFFFDKIFCNSTNVVSDLMIFEKTDLFKLVREYRVPDFNREFLEKRLKIIRNLFLGEKNIIRDLEWKL